MATTNSQSPNDFELEDDAPPAQQTPSDNGSLYYYRLSSGMRDWTAQMDRFWQPSDAVDSNGKLMAQNADADSSNSNSDIDNAPPNMQALRRAYDSQIRAASQFGQNQPITLGTTLDLPNCSGLYEASVIATIAATNRTRCS